MKNKINMITSTNWIINVCPHPEADVYEALFERLFSVWSEYCYLGAIRPVVCWLHGLKHSKP